MTYLGWNKRRHFEAHILFFGNTESFGPSGHNKAILIDLDTQMEWKGLR